MRHFRNFPSAALALAALLGCAAATAQRPVLVEHASGFASPVVVTNAGDDRLFVVEQGGRVRIVHDGTVLETPFLDITDRVRSGGERGLLGLAFPADFAGSGRFNVYYTDRDGDSVLSRFRAEGDAADPASEHVLLTQAQPASNHNGGQIAFGPDGYLYVGIGDGGGGGDPQGSGQRLDTLLGKVLRVDVSGEELVVPADNPFVDREGARSEIWAYGLRNPWRFSFDRETGDLFIADVGQNALEEVNLQPAGSPGGENYGWNVMEGDACFSPQSGCDQEGLVLPILVYSHASGAGRSITGGYVYRGSELPDLAGSYVFGDFVSGNVWRADPADGAWETTLLFDAGSARQTLPETKSPNT